MKIQSYTQGVTPTDRGGSAFSLPGEKQNPRFKSNAEVQYFGQMNKSVGVIGEIGKKFQEAARINEFTEAKISAREKLSDLDHYMASEEYLSTNEADDFEPYFNEQAGEIWEAISEKIKDPEAARQAQADFDGLKISYRNKARSKARMLVVESGKADTMDQLKRYRDLVLKSDQAGDSAAVADALENVEAMLAGRVKAGFFTAVEGKRLSEEFRSALGVTLWQQRIANDPISAAVALEKKMDYLDEADRVSLLQNARARAKVAQTQQAENNAYGLLKSKFGDDIEGAIDHLASPANIKKLGLGVRSAGMLTNVFQAELAEQRQRTERARREGIRMESDQVYNQIMNGDRAGAIATLQRAEHLPGETRYKMTEALKKSAWVTSPEVKALAYDKIRNQQITERAELLPYLGNGLSQADYETGLDMIEDEKGRRGQLNYYNEAVEWFKTVAPEDKQKWNDFKASLSYFMQEQGLTSADPKTYELGKKLWAETMVVGKHFGIWDDDERILDVMSERKPWLTGESPNVIDVDILDAKPEEVQWVYEFLDDEGYPITPANKKIILEKLRDGSLR